MCNIVLKEAKVGPERVKKSNFASFKAILQINGQIWINLVRMSQNIPLFGHQKCNIALKEAKVGPKKVRTDEQTGAHQNFEPLFVPRLKES